MLKRRGDGISKTFILRSFFEVVLSKLKTWPTYLRATSSEFQEANPFPTSLNDLVPPARVLQTTVEFLSKKSVKEREKIIQPFPLPPIPALQASQSSSSSRPCGSSAFESSGRSESFDSGTTSRPSGSSSYGGTAIYRGNFTPMDVSSRPATGYSSSYSISSGQTPSFPSHPSDHHSNAVTTSAFSSPPRVLDDTPVVISPLKSSRELTADQGSS